MLNTICTRKEKNIGIFIFWDLQNGINIIQFGELLWCAGTAPNCLESIISLTIWLCFLSIIPIYSWFQHINSTAWIRLLVLYNHALINHSGVHKNRLYSLPTFITARLLIECLLPSISWWIVLYSCVTSSITQFYFNEVLKHEKSSNKK